MMCEEKSFKIAILWRGDLEARQNATPANNRFHRIFEELAAVGIHAEPDVYDEDFADEVREQLLQLRREGLMKFRRATLGAVEDLLDAHLRMRSGGALTNGPREETSRNSGSSASRVLPWWIGSTQTSTPSAPSRPARGCCAAQLRLDCLAAPQVT
jgi:hypothetical protein